MRTELFVVTRQNYYYSGESVVEVAQGGRDYSGADALCSKYQGEFEEFVGMTDAVIAAIRIAKEWQRDAGRTKKILIGVGCSHGFGAEFEGMKPTKANCCELLKRAKAFDDKLPKCDQCGEVLGKDRYTMTDTADDATFCSEHCAERAYEFVLKLEVASKKAEGYCESCCVEGHDTCEDVETCPCCKRTMEMED